MALVMFALSHTVHVKFPNQIKCQKFALRHSTGDVQIHTGDFARIWATWEHTFTQTGNTRSERQV